ncbi:T9SS type A sorting domain-containing protein [Fluviicola sp.]|uniref:T9SS type A sorting domain-containing protein n=1 Tax=Fluviicola sp. TaxID=1917219 RepID=UPI0031D55411
MKRKLMFLLVSVFGLGINPVKAQTPFNPTTYSGWMTTPNNYFANLPAASGVTFSQPARGAGNQFSTAADGINSGQWQNTSSSDAIAANRYFVFSITANSSTSIQVDSLLLILARTSAGPDSCILQYKSPATGYNFVPVAPDTYTILNPSTDPTTSISVVPAMPLMVPASDSIVFRLVAWHASSSLGKMRMVNNTAVYGRAIPLNTIEAPNVQITDALCVSAIKGDSVQVIFNTTGTFDGGNSYTLELSDASGSFSTPLAIGSLNSSSNSGTIHGFIPSGTSSASYRLRVRSSNPAVTGLDTTGLLINSGIVLTASVLQPACPDNTGEIDLELSGGTGIIQYDWSTGQTTEDVANLPGGNVAVLVTDQAGCSADSSFQILPVPAFNVSATISNALCASCFGSIDLHVSGGNAPYSYWWSNNAASSQIIGVPGTYCVTVTDANNCTTDSCLVISSTAGLGEETSFVWTVFPNPASESVQLVFSSVLAGSKELIILDLSGRTVYQSSLTQETEQVIIPVKNWSNGAYQFLLITETGNSGSGRIVVSH